MRLRATLLAAAFAFCLPLSACARQANSIISPPQAVTTTPEDASGETAVDVRGILREYLQSWNREAGDMLGDSIVSLGNARFPGGEILYSCVLWYPDDWNYGRGMDGKLQGLVVNQFGQWIWWVFLNEASGFYNLDSGDDASFAPVPGSNQVACSLVNGMVGLA